MPGAAGRAWTRPAAAPSAATSKWWARPNRSSNSSCGLRQAGIDGLQLSFFDFKPDLEFFGDRILPLMKQAGLRT